MKLLKILKQLAPHAKEIFAVARDADDWRRANESNKRWHKTHYPEKYGIKRERN